MEKTETPIASSQLKSFRNQQPTERRDAIVAACSLSRDDASILSGADILSIEIANGMIENVIGKFELPMGVATNFVVNGKDYLVPMVVEEPSVVAAASYMAKIARACGGFAATSDAPIMRGQVQVLGISDPQDVRRRVLSEKQELIDLANSRDKVLIELGGGCKDIEVHA